MANVQTSKQAKPRSCVWDNMRTKKTPMITSVTISLPGSTRWWWRWPRPRQWPTPYGRVTMWEQPFLFRKMSHNFRKRISGLQHESNKSTLVFYVSFMKQRFWISTWALFSDASPHSPCQLESILENAKSHKICKIHSISQTLLKVFLNSILVSVHRRADSSRWMVGR